MSHGAVGCIGVRRDVVGLLHAVLLTRYRAGISVGQMYYEVIERVSNPGYSPFLLTFADCSPCTVSTRRLRAPRNIVPAMSSDIALAVVRYGHVKLKATHLAPRG